MTSNYKKLGQYIQPINIRNRDLEDLPLMGLSINKVFIPSIANTIGTNMANYKIIKRNQFAYGPVTSRNGDKITIALFEDYDKALISQAYIPFEVIDENILNPEYLMMWFRRPEFDRYARFKSHGSARETFDWEEMCEVELPVPSIKKQLEIVKEYNTVVNRIKLIEQLNQKLEDTAQALYKHWFVDFEFPNAEGKPYKSSGGEMVYNEELDKEIPVGWEVTDLGSLLKDKGYIRGPFGSALKKDDMVSSGVPVYEQQHAIYNHRNFRYFISNEKHRTLQRFSVQPNDLIISCSGTLGKITLIKDTDPIGVINQALLILRTDEQKFSPILLYYFLTSSLGNHLLIETAGGSAQVNIAKREVIQSIPFILAPTKLLNKAKNYLTRCFEEQELNLRESISLNNLKDLLLSKMTKVEVEKEII
ncbi:Type I restriction-modification system, specificity subunit S [Xanthomarina gelatinilytica]|uniref:Type I restriction-modification system, specificity subunit S n=1 Tax=Xanthomarina gelatinilytica TaxID=1137281 RepID=M7N0C5_9FLAO|nr:restriction endonuclease subunit S [Xanthomarina gelatinilytica]EMQ95194.1 Type I restriction-modification system, specificity subunit S [Xanthomarina gelatinilytica]